MSGITVLGGGIGGLALAACLRRRSIGVRVLEQAAELGEIGAGLQISPNGTAVLRALGFGDALAACAVRSRFVVLRDGVSGREVIRMPQAGAFYMLPRPRLIEMLAPVAGDVALGKKVDAVADGVLRFEDGQSESFDRLVGADGVHSRVRPLLDGEKAARFTGQVAWRAVVPAGMAAEAQVFLGGGRHLVAYPVGPEAINLVGVEERSEWREEGWRQPGDPDRFRAVFAGFGADAQALLARVERAHVWGLHLHPVARVWQRDRLAIMGDAAHPTLPFLAQGANLALEDAWCLAEALAAPDRPEALARYEAARRPRAERAIRAAAANARAYHLSGPAKAIAHLGLGLIGRVAPGAMIGRYDWLYRHDVTA